MTIITILIILDFQVILIGKDDLKAKTIIDVATLTGAMVVALGSSFTGTFCSSPSLLQELQAAGLKAGDRAWPMPLSPEYSEGLKSPIADLKNSGGRSGGACSAAYFLSQFVDGKDSIDWAHLDIAGVMDVASPKGYFQYKGMTGRPTRMLLEYLSQKEIN